MGRLRSRLDAFQRRHGWSAFTYAVVKRFGEDRAGQQAALLAYFGFFSLFPLLLVGVTVLGYALRNNPSLQERILDSALAQFPVIGVEIRENLGNVARSGPALLVGLAGALWGGLRGLKALQNALDHVWGVPMHRRGRITRQAPRALLMLGVLAVFVVASNGLSAVGAVSQEVPGVGRVATLMGSLALNVCLFLIVFKVLTVAEVGWRDVWPGAVVAAAGWMLLQTSGHYLIGRQLTQASELYGFFGIVLGLLSWMYLGGQLTLLAAEVNVVVKTRAWPRSLTPTIADGAPAGAEVPRATVEVSHTPTSRSE